MWFWQWFWHWKRPEPALARVTDDAIYRHAVELRPRISAQMGDRPFGTLSMIELTLRVIEAERLK